MRPAAAAAWLGLAALLGAAPCRAADAPLPLETLDAEQRTRLVESGIRVTPERLGQLAASVVRFDGAVAASGLLVSPHGLVVTRFAVGSACTPDDAERAAAVARDGFAAWTRADEIRCAGLVAELPAPDGGVTRYEDVRLVHIPERALATFGGDAEAGAWPRQRADVAFLRLRAASAAAPAAAGEEPAFAGRALAPLASIGPYRTAPAFVIGWAGTPEGPRRVLAWGIVDGYVPAGSAARRPWATTEAALFARVSDTPPWRLSADSLAQLGGVRTPGFVDRQLQDVPVAVLLRAALADPSLAGAPVFDGLGRLIGVHSGPVRGPDAPADGRAAVVTDLRFVLDLLIRRHGAVEVAAELGL
ncbi:MAG: hypothetical protein D6738_06895 [Acidobacteria bacterium]|nr:MAG: hypothetical protein D6738_06895 [Acidobacteriota bacterium]